MVGPFPLARLPLIHDTEKLKAGSQQLETALYSEKAGVGG
jgi:hypothetical protein